MKAEADLINFDVGLLKRSRLRFPGHCQGEFPHVYGAVPGHQLQLVIQRHVVVSLDADDTGPEFVGQILSGKMPDDVGFDIRQAQPAAGD